MGYERTAKLVFGTKTSEPSFEDWTDELKEWVIGELDLAVELSTLDKEDHKAYITDRSRDEGGLGELNAWSKTPFTIYPMTSTYCGLTGDEFGFGFKVDLNRLSTDPNYTNHLRYEWFKLFKNVEPVFALGVHTS